MKIIKIFSAYYNLPPLFFYICAIALLQGCEKKAPPELEFVPIPAGEFTLGSEDINIYDTLSKEAGRDRLLLESERPSRKIFQESFNIDKFEVTNRAYALFVTNTGHPAPPTWPGNSPPDGYMMHPVTSVSWYDSDMFCRSLGKRLPTETEWEKAARGPDGNRYPWGDKFDIKRANLDSGSTVPVDKNTEDVSAYGVRGMGGNVMEWTSSWFSPYPGSVAVSEEFGEKNKVLKSWSAVDIEHYNMAYINARSSARHFLPQDTISDEIGFRCAWDFKKKPATTPADQHSDRE